MKAIATDKWSVQADINFEGVQFKKGEIYMLGEIIFTSDGENILKKYGPEYIVDIPDETLQEIYKMAKPLALVREERIDEILS